MWSVIRSASSVCVICNSPSCSQGAKWKGTSPFSLGSPFVIAALLSEGASFGQSATEILGPPALSTTLKCTPFRSVVTGSRLKNEECALCSRPGNLETTSGCCRQYLSGDCTRIIGFCKQALRSEEHTSELQSLRHLV